MNLHMKMAVTVAGLAGAAALLLGLAFATPTPLAPPAFSGVAAFLGSIALNATPVASMTTLTMKPDEAVAGKRFTISGKGLPAGKTVTLT